MTNRKTGHPRFYEILEEMAELHSKKNTDYAKGGIQGALGNFHRVSSIMQLYPGMDWDSPFGVAMCYMLKQLDAALILRSTKRDSITGEPIPSRLLDISTYTNIASILYEEELPLVTAEVPMSKLTDTELVELAEKGHLSRG